MLYAHSGFRMPENEIAVRISIDAILLCGRSTLGTQEVEGLDVHFPMANSNTKFLPLASLGQLVCHCPEHRSLVPILRRLHVLRPTIMILFTFSFVACTCSVLTFHFLCPKWAAARHTGSKSKKLNGMLLYPGINGMSSYPESDPCRANILNHSDRIGFQ